MADKDLATENKHKVAEPAAVSSPSLSDTRWRASWSGTKDKQHLFEAKLDGDNKQRLTREETGGSDDYKVMHISEFVAENDITWYSSPPFRFSPTENDETVLVDIMRTKKNTPIREFLRGGPRSKVFFNPSEVRAVIATCGGICPGLNSVIRELVLCLFYTYGVKDIYGVKYGYEGFYSHEWRRLTPTIVSDIHHLGGTILGTSRGGFDAEKIVNSIVQHKANQVYLIGGDGTHRGAKILAEECMKRNLKIGVIGIPKTIDNDIGLIDKSFGFDSAVEEARKAIASAHVEAKSCTNGIGLVVLMGRASGFIALEATLASGEVNICLIPEVPFIMEGPHGLLSSMQERLRIKGHVVLVVAEGAGMDLLKPKPGQEQHDKSGNIRLPDVGSFLKNSIKEHFSAAKIEISMKYIDPSYMIRSVPANASDSVYTILLSQNAVYGAMAGFTNFTVALVNTHYCFVPIAAVTTTRKVDPTGNMWQRVLEITGQPDFATAN